MAGALLIAQEIREEINASSESSPEEDSSTWPVAQKSEAKKAKVEPELRKPEQRDEARDPSVRSMALTLHQRKGSKNDRILQRESKELAATETVLGNAAQKREGNEGDDASEDSDSEESGFLTIDGKEVSATSKLGLKRIMAIVVMVLGGSLAIAIVWIVSAATKSVHQRLVEELERTMISVNHCQFSANRSTRSGKAKAEWMSRRNEVLEAFKRSLVLAADHKEIQRRNRDDVAAVREIETRVHQMQDLCNSCEEENQQRISEGLAPRCFVLDSQDTHHGQAILDRDYRIFVQDDES